MKREIKFRAWDIECKIMREWEWIRKCEFPFYSDPFGASILDEKSFALMQFTGLKDKNGKEIYEGDVIMLHEYGEVYKPVIFANGAFCIHGFNFNNHNCSVIGNIYENPKLLNL